MPTAKAVLFDLDGTLIDTAPDFIAVLNRQRLAHGREPLAENDIRARVSQGSKAVVALGFGDQFAVESDEFEQIRQEFLRSYLQHLADNSRLFPHLDELLNFLESRQIAWGIVTNKPSLYTLPLLKALELDQRCKVVICPDMVTHTKPHPEPMLKAAKALHINPQDCIYVGDHRRDIEAGHNAEMTTVAVGYGYLLPDDNPHDWNAHHTVTTTDELLALFRHTLIQ